MDHPPHPTSHEPDPPSFPAIRDRIFRILTVTSSIVGWICILAFALKPFLNVKASAGIKLIEPAASWKINPVQVESEQQLISSPSTTPNQSSLSNVQQQQPIPQMNTSVPALLSSSRQNSAVKTAAINFQEGRKKFGWRKPINTLAAANRSQPLNSNFRITSLSKKPLPAASSSTSPAKKLETKNRANLLAETKQEQAQQPSVIDEQGILLTVSDIVILALQNNREIKNAYLERIAQRQDLAVEEDKFVPNFTPRISVALDRQRLGAGTSNSGGLDLGATVSMTLPAGGELSFGWNGTGRALTTNNFDDDFNEGGSLGQNLQLNFNQPLLRGFGVAVNRASIDIARLNEQSNVLLLKSTLINIITDAILAYRNLLQAQERVKIERVSLEIAQQQLENLQVLINAGRVAPVDIFPSETNVASRQVSLLAAENERDRARLALIQILDIERNTNILAAAPSALPTTPPDLNQLNQLAFTNNPNYLRSALALDISKFALLVAENDRKWNLDLNATYDNVANTGRDKTTDVRAGLTLSREFGDLTVEQRYQRSRVNQLQAENNLNDVRESLEIQVADRVRDVNLRLKQVELAQRARELQRF